MIVSGYKGYASSDNVWLSAILTGPIPVIRLITNAVCINLHNEKSLCF